MPGRESLSAFMEKLRQAKQIAKAKATPEAEQEYTNFTTRAWDGYKAQLQEEQRREYFAQQLALQQQALKLDYTRLREGAARARADREQQRANCAQGQHSFRSTLAEETEDCVRVIRRCGYCSKVNQDRWFSMAEPAVAVQAGRMIEDDE